MASLRTWHIVISPMHMVVISAEEMQQHNEVLTFTRAEKRVAQFSQYMGWLEFLEEPKERASVTPFTVVPKAPTAAPPGWDGNGSPVDDTPPAALLSFPFRPERP